MATKKIISKTVSQTVNLLHLNICIVSEDDDDDDELIDLLLIVCIAFLGLTALIMFCLVFVAL